tara:strand:- start:963 stop:1547 length:585 start_codon:yes stop_codon:yes gene_type:complete
MQKEDENNTNHFSGKIITDDNFKDFYKTSSFFFILFVMFWLYKFNKTGSVNLFKNYNKNTNLSSLLASERTYLAYTRTSVSFIGLGIALYKMFDKSKIMKILSILMMLAAISIILFGNISYMETSYSLSHSKQIPNNNFSMFIFTTMIVLIIIMILLSTNEDNIVKLIDEYISPDIKNDREDMTSLTMQQLTVL